MNKSDLKKLSKAELIDLLLKKQQKRKPIPILRRSVQQMVADYEQNIIRDKPIPAPRTKITKRKMTIEDNALSFDTVY